MSPTISQNTNHLFFPNPIGTWIFCLPPVLGHTSRSKNHPKDVQNLDKQIVAGGSLSFLLKKDWIDKSKSSTKVTSNQQRKEMERNIFCFIDVSSTKIHSFQTKCRNVLQMQQLAMSICLKDFLLRTFNWKIHSFQTNMQYLPQKMRGGKTAGAIVEGEMREGIKILWIVNCFS